MTTRGSLKKLDTGGHPHLEPLPARHASLTCSSAGEPPHSTPS